MVEVGNRVPGGLVALGVGAGGEGAARAGDHGGVYALVGGGAIEQRQQLVVEGGADRVEAVLAVDRQRGDAAGDLVADEALGRRAPRQFAALNHRTPLPGLSGSAMIAR